MAVTGFWPIYKNLKATLDYADNPDKTTDRRYLDDDLYAALSYAENDNKTDRKMYVGGINCSKQNAYSEMIAVQRRFGIRGKVVGYHGIQSFREGEVTPEQAFEIGKATARKMWGDRYGQLTAENISEILSREKANQKETIKIPTEKLRKYAPNADAKQLEDFILKACDHYRKYLIRQRNRDER